MLVWADDALLVLDKPSGLLSVPGKGADKQDCLSTRVQAQYPEALIVHRLDMATSGLMLMARNAAMQRQLSQAFASRQVTKRYAAVVAGTLAAPPGEWGEIDQPIGIDWPRRPLRVIDPVGGKPSLTRWQLASESADACITPANPWPWDPTAPFTRLTLAPVTGRSHQLRVHLAALGHPILGDALYAPTQVLARASRLLLHATTLTLVHPATGETLHFASPVPF